MFEFLIFTFNGYEIPTLGIIPISTVCTGDFATFPALSIPSTYQFIVPTLKKLAGNVYETSLTPSTISVYELLDDIFQNNF